MSSINFQDVEKFYRKQKVINKLTLSIHNKELYGLVGPSGCGKSTLIKLLLGIQFVNSGSIYYDKQNITNKPAILKKIVGYCTQENSFYSELTVEENFTYYGRMYHLPLAILKERTQELLSLTGLQFSRKRLAQSLSGGMKRRLDFGIALVHDPDILILDEPTTGLDPILREKIFQLIKDINMKGKTVILISHHLSYLQRYCTRIGIMDQGVIKIEINPLKIPKKLSAHHNLEEVFQTLFHL